jgi:hypothetical protein
MNIKQFKTLRAPLVKAFDNIEITEAKLRELIRGNFYENIFFTAGAKSEKESCWWSKEEIEELFGLPYTSSGDFAGLWVTNTQAVNKYGEKKISFRCATIDTNGDCLLIFEDSEEQFYYFYDCDFAKWQAYEKTKAEAVAWAQFVKDANKIAVKVFEIVKKYNGKAYGEKTRQKIREEINQEAQKFGCSAWLDASRWGGVEISKGYKIREFYHMDFLNNENKITITEENAPEAKKEVDGAKTFDKLAKMRESISKKAKELKELIEEARGYENDINNRAKASESLFSVNLDYLARGVFDR